MKLKEFKINYSLEQGQVMDALIQQVRDCTKNEFGYLSHVSIPGGMTKKMFNGIVEEFKTLDLIHETGMADGYEINKILEGCFGVVSISKEEEIKLLAALVEGEGYFADFFKVDLDQMVRNIGNDHPIEFDTIFHSAVETQKKRGVNLIKKHVAEKYSLYETMLCVASETGNDRLYERVIEEIGLDAVIKLKHVLGLEIDDKEIKHLVSKL